MFEPIWIQGDPATFATSKEKQWKEQVLTRLSSVPVNSCSLDMEFRLSEANGEKRGYDLDNLCDPIFSVLTSQLGWYEGKQTNIQRWRAIKRINAEAGLLIQPLKDIEESVDQSSILIDQKYDGILPKSATSYELPLWLKSLEKIPKVYQSCSISLTLVNINRSIASLSDGLVKHVIDCLYLILGGHPGDPDDHKINELVVKREKIEGKGSYIHLIIWSDNEVEKANSELNNRVNHLIDELHTINELFVAYERLYNKQATDLNVLNWTPGFFQITLHSFINEFAVKLSRLYDRNKDANSLYTLYKYLEANSKHIGISLRKTQEVIDEAKRVLDDKEELVRKLKKLRNSCLAHNDLGFVRDDTWKKFSPTIGEYRSLITSAHEVISFVGNLLDLPTFILGMGVGGEIDYLITTLKKGYEMDELSE